ncbi:hypothetical protein X975_14147, partial [Stegodyphus mimosarum]
MLSQKKDSEERSLEFLSAKKELLNTLRESTTSDLYGSYTVCGPSEFSDVIIIL